MTVVDVTHDQLDINNMEEVEIDAREDYIDELDDDNTSQFNIPDSSLLSDTVILEQLCIVNQNIAEFEAILGKHEGCFARIIVGVLKNNEVALQAYFD